MPEFNPWYPNNKWGYPIYNVKGYGALGDSTNGVDGQDDTEFIQAAIDACIADSGGSIYIPQGIYRITAPLTFFSAVHCQLRIFGEKSLAVGSGTMLVGNFDGYVVNHPYGSGENFFCFEHIGVTNYHINGRGLLIEGAGNGEIGNCHFTCPDVGINIGGDAYVFTIHDCQFTGGGKIGSKGAMVGQAVLIDNNFIGWDIGIYRTGYGGALIGNRLEVDRTAIVLAGAGGLLVAGNQTERCNIAIDIGSCAGGLITSNVLTGTVGVPHLVSNLVWAAGVVTVTSTVSLAAEGWTSGNRPVSIENAVPAGYNNVPAPGFFTGTRTSDLTFTYPLAVNPGTWVDNAQTTWSLPVQYGIKMGSMQGTVISGNTLGGWFEQAGFFGDQPNYSTVFEANIASVGGAPHMGPSWSISHPLGSTFIGNDQLLPVTTKTSAFVLDETLHQTVKFNSVSAIYLEVRNDSQFYGGHIPNNYEYELINIGVGQASITVNTGLGAIVVHSQSGNSKLNQYGRAKLRRLAANEWLLSGDLVA